MASIKKGIVWSGVESFGVQAVSFFVSIVIARLVSPTAYGLIAMIGVFTSFFQLFVNGGLSSALIQKKDQKEIDYNTTFFSNLIVSILLYGVMYLGAPYIARFYNQPELTAMTRWVSVTLVIQALTIIQKTRLNILIDFKTQAIASISSLVVGGIIGIWMAYSGYGVWALIYQTIASQITTSLMLVLTSKWVPKLQFSLCSFKRLFSFGSKELLIDIFTSFYINISNLVIGKFYSPSALAYYNRGYHMGYLPAGLWANTFSRISYPVLCKHQDNRDTLLAYYYKFISLGSFVMFPIMTIISIYANPITIVLLTEKWQPAVPYIIIMSLTFMTYPFNVSVSQIVHAVGHPEKSLKALVYIRAISFSLLFASVPFGVKWIAISIFANTYIGIIISSFVSARTLKIKVLSQYQPLIKPILACLIIAVIGIPILYITSNSYIQLIIGIPITIASYMALTFILKMPEKTIIHDLFLKIKSFGKIKPEPTLNGHESTNI